MQHHKKIVIPSHVFVNLIDRSNKQDTHSMDILHSHYIYEDHLQVDYSDGAVFNFCLADIRPYSTYQLAIMYYTGKGVEKNTGKAIHLLHSSIKLGCSQAYVTAATWSERYKEKELVEMWSKFYLASFGKSSISSEEMVNMAWSMGNIN